LQDQARDYFKRLEEGDLQVRALWQKLSDLSMVDFNRLYEKFNIRFDTTLGESFYEPFLQETIDELQKKGLAVESEGALVIPFDEPDLAHPPLMIRKTNGTSTYATRDLAGIRYRFSHYQLDSLVIEIGNEQEFYFRQIIRAAEKSGWAIPGQLVHIGHGLFLGASGKKLSTRRGETVWLVELLDELTERARDIISQKSPELPEQQREAAVKAIAIGALKYNDLSQNRLSNIVFDKEKALSLDGNSALYLQYSYARGKSVLRQSGQEISASSVDISSQMQLDALTPPERSLWLYLDRFDEVVIEAAKTALPSTLATYLFNLAQKFNLFYHTDSILQSSEQTKMFRLVLVSRTTEMLKIGLNLLGIDVVERM
jgi:arginyl-tRNA synthetase